MLASAKRYELPDPLSAAMAKGVADLLAARDPLAALLFARLCSDWADGIPYRGVANLAETIGIGTTYMSTVTKRLEGYGLLVVERAAGRQLGYELRLPILNGSSTDENVSLVRNIESEGGSGVISTPTHGVKWNVNQEGVSVGYVRLCEFGTQLAKYIYCSYNCLDTAICLDTATAVKAISKQELQLPATRYEIIGAEGGGHSAAEIPKTPEVVRPKRKNKRPVGSAGFRQATNAEVAADEHYAVIAGLHDEWCKELGVELKLSNWRYAAWRGALVEAGYTVAQLRSAFPAVAADAWWRERPDPHFMFGNNPSKIERFFPNNVVTASADRFAQRRPTIEPFDFEF